MNLTQDLKVQKLGCGGTWSHTSNGSEFDCEHGYDWTCDHCPCHTLRENQFESNHATAPTEVYFDGIGLREIPAHYDLNIMINLHWAEGLEGEFPRSFNLVEDPETGKSTPWDFEAACTTLTGGAPC